MPTVPFPQKQAQGGAAPSVDKNWLMVAAGELHNEGRLFEPDQLSQIPTTSARKWDPNDPIDVNPEGKDFDRLTKDRNERPIEPGDLGQDEYLAKKAATVHKT